MTSTVSFKDKLKQIFSVILWDLKGCKGSLMVYTILASVFTVIIFTLVFVLTADQTSFSPLFSTESSPKISLSEKMQVFQVISSTIIGFLTLIFAIIYTVQIFSYMHNKRKVDFYGSLPISRARRISSRTQSGSRLARARMAMTTPMASMPSPRRSSRATSAIRRPSR